MAISIIFMKLTDQGARNIKEAPQRIEQGIKAFEAMGGKMLEFYATMGEWDYVAIGEGPSEELAMIFTMGLGSLGNVRTTTLRAFTREQFAEMVRRLP